MSSTDGQPTYPVHVQEPPSGASATQSRRNLTPEQRRVMREHMVKYLSQDSTVDEMREDMRKLLQEDGWHENIEKEMTRVVNNCDVTQKPYVEMLKDLGQIPYKPGKSESETDAQAKTEEMNKLLKELAMSPNFTMKDGLKQRLFERWDHLFGKNIRDAYDNSLPKQRDQ